MLQVDWTESTSADDPGQSSSAPFVLPSLKGRVGYLNSDLVPVETQRSSGMIIEVQSYQLRWQVGYGLQGQAYTPNHDNRSRNTYGYPWHGKTCWLDKTLWGILICCSNCWRLDCARYTVPERQTPTPDPVSPGLCCYYWKYVLTEHRNEDERERSMLLCKVPPHRKVYAWMDPSVWNVCRSPSESYNRANQ